MNKVNKKAKYINLAAQCVLYISVAVFSITNSMDIELPAGVIIILRVLDLLTIPAFMYAYVKSIEGDSK